MKRWSWLITFVVALAIYLPTLNAELVWDDEIVQKRQLVAFQSARDVFFPPAGIQEWAKAYYRPLVLVSYLMDRGLYGSERFYGHHFTNVLIHAAVSAFVVLLVRRLLCGQRYGEWGALAAGIIFALHPIHVESISPIMGRSDTLAAAFMLPSIILALHYRDRPRAGWVLPLAPLFYLCALLSKEVAISTLLLLPLLLLIAPRVAGTADKARRDARRTSKARKATRRAGKATQSEEPPLRRIQGSMLLGGLYLVATVIYFVLRTQAGCTSGASLRIGLRALFERGCRAWAYYVAKVFVPPPQSAFVTLREMPSLTLGIAAVVLGVGLGILAVYRWRRGTATILIAWVWLVATLAPSMIVALRKISEQPVAQRYLYLPSVAVALLVGAALCRAVSKQRLRRSGLAAAVIVACLYGGQTLARERVWQNNIAFWTNTAAKAPYEGLPIYQLGLAYNKPGTYDKALECFAKSLSLYDDAEGLGLAHNSIGTVQMARGDEAAAEASFVAAIAERPGYRTPYFNLGSLYAAQAERSQRQSGQPAVNRLEKACQYLGQAVRLSPSYVKAQFFLAQQTVFLADARARAGDVKAARTLMRDARKRIAWLADYDSHGEYGRRAAALVPTLDGALRKLSDQP